jgi:hypothetical protein
MTEAEALVFLGAGAEDDLEDAFDEQLFQFRQFFTSKPIIGKTFRNRLEKLEHLDQAAKVLGLKSKPFSEAVLKQFDLNGTILHDFLNYQDLKSDWMLKMHRAEGAEEMKELTLLMLEVEFTYTGMWKDVQLNTDAVILSREPDPMALLSDIRHAEEAGIVTFSDLAGDLTDRFEQLKKESKRMFLLHEKETEWKTSF